jgi:hypothetical protein
MEGPTVLPSQTAPTVRRRAAAPRRRKSRRVPLLIAAILLIPGTVLGIRYLAPESGAPDTASAAKTQPAHMAAAIPQRSDRPAPEVAAAPDPTPPAPIEAEVEIAEIASPPARRPEPAPPAQAPLGSLPSASRQRALDQLRVGMELAETNRPVDARRALTSALDSGALEPSDAEFARDALSSLNQRLIFSPEVVDGDPYSQPYVVAPGDRLGGIVRKQGLAVDWRFILRVNRMLSERSLRAGQRLKLVTGPFHAEVIKSAFRLDLYQGTGASRVFVASFPVGLGEFDQTPVGRFRVRPSSKLIDPQWTNPRTGQRYAHDDPENPIGERWIGLMGDDDATRAMAGYGIHGTIEPESIGRSKSMGCIRMLPDDVALLYEVLTEDVSTVTIRP